MPSFFIKTPLLAACMILSLSSSSGFAKQYYKWVDSKGSTHYTSTPPPKTAQKKGKINTYGTNASVASRQAQAAAKNNAAQQEAKPNMTIVTGDKIIVVPKQSDAPQPLTNAPAAALEK